eukprot:jgi/Bigna1/128480/aug1.6_g3188
MADDAGEVEEKAPKTDTFDRLAEIWKENETATQRKKSSEIFGLADGPGVCRDSLVVDFSFLTLCASRDLKFSQEQTKIFYELIMQLKGIIEEPKSTVEQAMQHLKSILIDPKSNDAKERKAPDVFTPTQKRNIIDYTKQHLFSHFSLLKAAFSEDFHQDKKTVHFRLNFEDAEENYNLDRAEEKTAEEVESELKKDTFKSITKLIESKAKSAKVATQLKIKIDTIQERMQKSLEEKEAQLSKKIEDLTSQLKNGMKVSSQDLKAVGL